MKNASPFVFALGMAWSLVGCGQGSVGSGSGEMPWDMTGDVVSDTTTTSTGTTTTASSQTSSSGQTTPAPTTTTDNGPGATGSTAGNGSVDTSGGETTGADTSGPEGSGTSESPMTSEPASSTAGGDSSAPATSSAPTDTTTTTSAPTTDTPMDPLFAAATCTSNKSWTRGENESMRPGEACVACHTRGGEGPRYAIAGTLYPTGHEPNDCNGTAGGAKIVITDANNQVHELTPNQVGNFFYNGSIATPYTAKVVTSAGERQMFSPQTVGDCNTCHTADGTTGAPGRIVVPF